MPPYIFTQQVGPSLRNSKKLPYKIEGKFDVGHGYGWVCRRGLVSLMAGVEVL